MSDHRARLVAFYTKFNPEKLSSVDATLEKFKGKEEAMFAALAEKYQKSAQISATGSSPASPTAPPASGASTASGGGVGAGAIDWRARLIAFYTHYGKTDKLAGVDATLEKFRGKEEAMLAALVSKYGPEPVSGRASGGAGGGAGAGAAIDWKERLTRFYTYYGKADKLEGVDATLEKFRGKEEAMMMALQSKYGPEPHADAARGAVAGGGGGEGGGSGNSGSGSGSGDYRARLLAFYQKHAPEKATEASVDAVLTKYAGREEALFATLASKYGAEAAAPQQQQQQQQQQVVASPGGALDFKQRLTLLYQKYCPDKLSKVDDHLTKYTGREEDYIKALTSKYGPEPTPSPASPSLPPAPTAPAAAAAATATATAQQSGGASAAAPLDFKQRAILFYQKYAPDKVSKVDDHLLKYQGREEDFFRALVSKYGPEPVATPAQQSLSLPPTAPAVAAAEPLSFKQRLALYYQKYCPEKAAKIDEHCSKYAGREEDYIKALVSKYGPEPAPPRLAKAPAPLPQEDGARGAASNNNNNNGSNTNDEDDLTSPSSSGNNKSRSIASKKPDVDPVQQVIAQQISMLSAADAAQLGQVATSPAFLALVRGVAGTLGGGLGGGAGLEQRVRALVEQEGEERAHVVGVEEDERGIVAHMHGVAHAKLLSAEESEALQRKTNLALRALYFSMWSAFARGRLKQRREETLAALTPYQRVAFRSFMKKNPNATVPGPTAAAAHGAGPHSPRDYTAVVGSPTLILSPQKQQQRSHSSLGRSPRGRSPGNAAAGGNASGIFSAAATPRTAAATPRGVSAQPSTARSALSGAAPTPRQSIKQINTLALGQRGQSGFASIKGQNASRLEQAKSRHTAEARVEKLSDNQVKSLHRRLEKWGLPVPQFLNDVVRARGLATPATTPRDPPTGSVTVGAGAGRSGSQRSNNSHADAHQPAYLQGLDAAFGAFGRFAPRGAAAAAAGSTPSAAGDDNGELDATVLSVLREMQAQNHAASLNDY